MDSLKIRLDCDEWTSYGNLVGKSGKIKCPECKNHIIDVEFCLNLLVNKEKIKRKKIEVALEENIEKTFERNLERKIEDTTNLIDLQCEKAIKDINNYRQKLINDLATGKQNFMAQMKKMDFNNLSKETFEREINTENNLGKKLEIEQKYEDMINETKDGIEKIMDEKYFHFKIPQIEQSKIDELIGKLEACSLKNAPKSYLNYTLDDFSKYYEENYHLRNPFNQMLTNYQHLRQDHDTMPIPQPHDLPQNSFIAQMKSSYQTFLEDSRLIGEALNL
ncbi:hypothetical protein BpHYR1_043291 [Brachionus plicatilis]|uniref:Uncharacterized protein n=1 Tax=Brachionus plicatilis TaxID=10195 RepID=A0A3M7PWC7_BRAPC|nr:hypothetical protein BpHYR1_043291 [Brachionus plicatilis]